MRISENVWIGSGAIFLAGVTVGNDAIIGAGSVGTRDVPPRRDHDEQPSEGFREGGDDLRAENTRDGS